MQRAFLPQTTSSTTCAPASKWQATSRGRGYSQLPFDKDIFKWKTYDETIVGFEKQSWHRASLRTTRTSRTGRSESRRTMTTDLCRDGGTEAR